MFVTFIDKSHYHSRTDINVLKEKYGYTDVPTMPSETRLMKSDTARAWLKGIGEKRLLNELADEDFVALFSEGHPTRFLPEDEIIAILSF